MTPPRPYNMQPGPTAKWRTYSVTCFNPRTGQNEIAKYRALSEQSALARAHRDGLQPLERTL